MHKEQERIQELAGTVLASAKMVRKAQGVADKDIDDAMEEAITLGDNMHEVRILANLLMAGASKAHIIKRCDLPEEVIKKLDRMEIW